MNFILILGILLILGLASTRLMKVFKLPNVTGYLIVGLLTALGCILIDYYTNDKLGLTTELVSLNEVVSGVALGFIALSIGEEFKLVKIKKYGTKILLITFLESFCAMILVIGVVMAICLILHLPIEVALCLGAIACATAPAATLMVINQYKARGPLVDILLPVVAFDDAVGLIFFSIAVSISKVIATGTSPSIVSLLLVPLVEIFGSLLLGFVLGFLLRQTINFFKSRNNHVMMLIAFTLIGVGTCSLLKMIRINGENLEFSNLLCCMMIGATYINLGENKDIVERDFSLVERWTPSLLLLFFVLSGAHLVTSAKELLASNINMGYIAIVFAGYLIARSSGKYLGASIGARITKREKTITHYLGVTLLPQAGVAIGMANQISTMEAFSGGTGNIIVTVVLCATLVYELFGPLLTKWSLNRSGEIPRDDGTYPWETSQAKNSK
ncbi:MAG: cation:proton antiporter [Bacilli bacterium]|nr:cation:proton antiporter [Bacillales bacterium]MDY2575415.1 cation:proton antiporter [Bacilli bacterium]